MPPIPNQQHQRQNYNYIDIAMNSFFWDFGLGLIVVFSLFVILFVAKLILIKKKKNHQQNFQSQEILSSSQITNINAQQTLLKQNKSAKLTFNIINISTSIFFYTNLLFFAIFYLIAFMFGKMGVGIAKDILSIFALTMVIVVPTLIWKYFTKMRSLSQMRKQIIITVIILILWFIISIFAILGSRKACICGFNNFYGVKINPDFKFSTQYTRSKTIGKVCQQDSICNIYATLPEDTDTSVFINIHTSLDINKVQVAIKSQIQYQKNPYFDIIESGQLFPMGKTIQDNGKRNVFSVLFNKLQPQTIYVLRIQAGTKTLMTKYQTLPNQESNTELRIAFGGDVGMTQQAQKLISSLSNFNPHVIIVGGDIAYDNAMPTCYYSWDNYYNLFNPLYNKLGRLVPMILTIGNHDVGFDALTNIKININQEGPYFFSYNPQHFSDNINKVGIPKISQRKSYHYHKIGKTVHMILDSGYLHKFQDQVSFIQTTSINFALHQKFSNYHNPIYSSCVNPTSKIDQQVYEASRRYWVPIFEKYNFTASMEHHTHQMKITKPLMSGKVNQSNGIIYIGDGSLGVYNQPCPMDYRVTEDIFYHTDSDNTNHIWLMTVKNEQIYYEAKNVLGETMSSYKQSFKQFNLAEKNQKIV